MTISLPGIGKVGKPFPLVLGVVTAGLIAAGGTAAWRFHSLRNTVDLDQYTVLAQTEQNLTLRIAASGTIVPIQTVNLSPKAAGRLTQLYVEQGDRVTAGQIIARMDNVDLQARLDQARANLAEAVARQNQATSGNRWQEIAQAKAQVEAAQARVTLTSRRVARNRSLANEGAISRDRLDEVIADDTSAKANLLEAKRRLSLSQAGSRPEAIRQSQASVAAAAAQVKAAQVALDDTVIRAPFAGIITQRFATVGAFVTPTTSASATASATSTSVVAVASGLEILAKVPEVDIGQVRRGQTVEIVADAFPSQTFQGNVRLVSPEAVVDQSVTSFQVRVGIRTGLNQLRSGMNTDLSFLGAKLPNALVIPTVAVATEKGQTGVYVPGKDNKPEFRPVNLGASVQNKTQILSGLRSGDRVFIDFPDDLRPKQSTSTQNR
jgi:HlyD family secretion protein